MTDTFEFVIRGTTGNTASAIRRASVSRAAAKLREAVARELSRAAW